MISAIPVKIRPSLWMPLPQYKKEGTKILSNTIFFWAGNTSAITL
jgi:hypothetical protein